VNRIEIVADGAGLADLLAGSAGRQIFHVDLDGVSTLRDVVRYIGRGIGAPSYLGHNLDAVEEVLRDLVGQGWYLVLANADRLLQLPRKDLDTLMSVLVDVSDFWLLERIHFTTVIVGGAALRDAVQR
jgi:hypothetical protein